MVMILLPKQVCAKAHTGLEMKKRTKELTSKHAPLFPLFQQDKEEIKMPWDQAIRIIQVHERARQGRLRARFMREIRQQEEREKQAQTRGAPTLDPDVAAMRIQKVGWMITVVVC